MGIIKVSDTERVLRVRGRKVPCEVCDWPAESRLRGFFAFLLVKLGRVAYATRKVKRPRESRYIRLCEKHFRGRA